MTEIQQHNSETIIHSTYIATDLTQFIIASFQNQLKVNKLLKNIPKYNTHNFDTLHRQFIAYFYLQGQSKYQKQTTFQDSMPSPIQMDNIINFHIKVQNSDHQILSTSKHNLLQTSKQFLQSNNSIQKFSETSSLNYSLSKSHQNNKNSQTMQKDKLINPILINSPTQQVNQFLQETVKQKQRQTQNSSQLINKQQLSSAQLIPLKTTQQKQDPQVENQLQGIKKHLYMMRRYRKKNIQEQRQRLDNLAKKKSNLLYSKQTQHTYQYDGTLIKLKKQNRNTSLINQLKPNTSRQFEKQNGRNIIKNKQKKGFSEGISSREGQSFSFLNGDQKTQNNNPQRKLSSQQLKKISFNNCNKRQISHLPFILLKQNTKLIQNKKELSGSTTLRTSLNRSKISSMSLQNNKFKSFAHIEQQKRLQKSGQKVLQLTQSQDNMGMQILPPTLQLNLHCQPLRKQSKMMQKYLSKLTEQKSKLEKWIEEDKSQKSFNFQQIKVPQRYPIQRYYEYDFEGEKQNFQFQITSKLTSKRSSIMTGMDQN